MQNSRSIHLPTLGQLILSGLGFLLFASITLGLLAWGLVDVVAVNQTGAQTAARFSLAGITMVCAGLCIPSVYLSALRIFNKPLPQLAVRFPWLGVAALALLWILALVGGAWASSRGGVLYLLTSLMQVLVVGLPVLAFLNLGGRGLQRCSPQRSWGIVLAGVTLTQPLTFLVEGLVMLIMGLGVLVFVVLQPQLSVELQKLAMQLSNVSPDNSEALLHILEPLIANPVTVFLILIFGAGLVPLVEEFIKPIALWFFAGRRFSPQEGFYMGLICGSVFAFVESLGMFNAVQGEEWLMLAIARVGTGLLHITTTSMVGWGLGMAWSRGKYVQLGLVYFLGVLMHGIWNTFGLLMGIGVLLPVNSPYLNLGWISPILLCFLSLILFLLLVGNNRKLVSSSVEK